MSKPKEYDPAAIVAEVTGGNKRMTGPGRAEVAPVGFKDSKFKDPWRLFSWKFARGIVKVLAYGVKKYADEKSGRTEDNWRNVPNALQAYKEAFMRHWVAREMGEVVDAESGLPHTWHMGCNLMFISELDKESDK